MLLRLNLGILSYIILPHTNQDLKHNRCSNYIIVIMMQSSDDLSYRLPEDSSSSFLGDTSTILTLQLEQPVNKQFISYPISENKSIMLKNSDLSFLDDKVPPKSYKILNDRISVYGSNQQQILERYKIIETELVNRLVYITFIVDDIKQVYILTQSPSIQKFIHSNQCVLTNSKTEINISSFCRSIQELQKIKDKIKNHKIMSFQWRNISHKNSIYIHVSDYLKLAISAKKDFFKERQITTQFNKNNSHIYIKGNEGVKKIQARNLISNIVQSTIIFQIRTSVTPKQFKDMELYFKKVTDHPIIFRQQSQNVYILISKDNIIKQILGKDKFKSFMRMDERYKIGIFLLEPLRNGQKITALRTFVTNHHNILEEKGIFHYVVESMKNNKDKIEDYLNFIQKIIDYLTKTKNKSDINIKVQKNHNLPNLDKDQFLHLGEVVPYKDTMWLSTLFGCDIKMRKMYLNQKYLKEYQDFFGQQKFKLLFSAIQWCDSSQTKIINIEKGKMKGKYYLGNVKTNENKNFYLPEYLIETI